MRLAASDLLADDRRVWRPPAALCALWTWLRLAVLHALWCAACTARMRQRTATARTVAASVLCHCRELIVQHWFRVDLHRAGLDACPHWLLSRDPSISVGTFQGWWCGAGALCRVSLLAGARPKLTVRWDSHTPVPLPMPVPVPPLDVAVGDRSRHDDLDLGEELDLLDVDIFE